MSVYTDNGYQSRKDYLQCLAEDMGLPRSVVFALADVLGPNEDFDGLITECEDAADSCEFEDSDL